MRSIILSHSDLTALSCLVSSSWDATHHVESMQEISDAARESTLARIDSARATLRTVLYKSKAWVN